MLSYYAVYYFLIFYLSTFTSLVVPVSFFKIKSLAVFFYFRFRAYKIDPTHLKVTNDNIALPATCIAEINADERVVVLFIQSIHYFVTFVPYLALNIPFAYWVNPVLYLIAFHNDLLVI